MKIAWAVSAGVPPFAWAVNWTTRNTEVPRIGETVQDGGYGKRFRVMDIVWNYSVDTVFIHVERLDRGTAPLRHVPDLSEDGKAVR